MIRPTREQVDHAIAWVTCENADKFEAFGKSEFPEDILAAEVRALRERNEQLETDMQCRNELSARIRTLEADNARLRAELELARAGEQEAIDRATAHRATIARVEALVDRWRGVVRDCDALRDKDGYASEESAFNDGVSAGDVECARELEANMITHPPNQRAEDESASCTDKD